MIKELHNNQEVTSMSPQWKSQDYIWMLSLYGTAIGAGVLFLPIDAGLHGIWPLMIMLVLAFPMSYFSHLALCRFVLSSTTHEGITDIASLHFGKRIGNIFTVLYFFAIYPILLMYSVAITNTTESFIVHQLGLPAPPRFILAIALLLCLMTIIKFGQQMIVKCMSVLVFPFIFILIALSLYLIPHWNTAILNINPATTEHSFLMTIWLIIPVMVFSFNHSPIISSFAIKQKESYGTAADKKSTVILKYSNLLMVFTVMLFVFSCVFSLSPVDLANAKQQNITILSYLANHFQTPAIAYVAPIIAFIAISKSFLGHYLGASEGLQDLISKALQTRNKLWTSNKIQLLIELFMIVTCWIIATINPNILKIIETLGGPIIAIILFIMPMYAIATVPAMKKYQLYRFRNVFISLIGLVAVSAILYGIIYS